MHMKVESSVEDNDIVLLSSKPCTQLGCLQRIPNFRVCCFIYQLRTVWCHCQLNKVLEWKLGELNVHLLVAMVWLVSVKPVIVVFFLTGNAGV